MAAVTEDRFVVRGGRAAMKTRERINFLVFLGPAIALMLFFLILPIVVDVVISFTDMGASLKVNEFTTKQFTRILSGDRRLPSVVLTTFLYVLGTLAVFNVTFALVLALVTTAIPKVSGGFFRAIWLLPRMSPSVLYILLWIWVIEATDFGLINQVGSAFGLPLVDLLSNSPLALIVVANGFIGASMGMIIFTSAIRSVPEHLYHAARVDGAGALSIIRHITLPAIRWPLGFITVYQTLSLLVSFEYILLLTKGGPFFDTTVYTLYIYKRAFESGQYAYGAALSLIVIVIGMAVALLGWRLFDMKALLQEPRIEVQ